MKYLLLFLTLFALPSGLLWAGESEEVEDTGDMDLWNPFFLPYKGEFYLDLATNFKSEQRQLNLKTVSGGVSTKKNDVALGATVKYGIFDSFTIGVEASYMIRQDYTETASGALAAFPTLNGAKNGFYDLGFIVDLRLLGKYRKDWYANLELGFRPGIRDDNNTFFSYPNNQYLVTGTFGKSAGMWTFGTLVSIKYYQKSEYDTTDSKNNELQGIPEIFIQADFGPLYARAVGGGIKFLDKNSNDNAVKKNFLPALGGEIGFPLSDNAVLRANVLAILQTSGNVSLSGTAASMTLGPIIIGSIAMTQLF